MLLLRLGDLEAIAHTAESAATRRLWGGRCCIGVGVHAPWWLSHRYPAHAIDYRYQWWIAFRVVMFP